MTLNQLEYFCAVCRYHSITRAADELFVSQPTISVALRNLENEFHLRLFNHGKNQISLTPEGEAFYQKAEQILNSCQDFQAEFSSLASCRRPLKVGIPPMLSTVFFPHLMTEFQKKHNIPLQLLSHGSVRACSLVESEELDVAIANLDFYNVDKFNFHVMLEDSYVFCVSKSHPLAKHASVSIEEIGDTPLILFSSDSVQNRTVISRYQSLRRQPNILMYSSQLYTMLSFIREGLGGAFFYRSIPIEDPDVVRIPITPPITSNIGLVWKKGVYINEATSQFIGFIKGVKWEK